MSNAGQSPTQRRTRYTPQSADPVNPMDGDLFFSDGTPRAEGLWVWFNAAWQQVSTSGALSTVNELTFTPQAADPGSPTAGMVFYADGTSRAEGLWLYDGTNWVQLSPGANRTQEASIKASADVRVATTANLILVSQVENGDIIDGVVLVTGNRVLLKNQTIASENGVYTVNLSGAPTRATDADTFQELNEYVAHVTAGTVNTNTVWYQTATLTSLGDAQVWSQTLATQNMVVPGGVTLVRILGAGGGGGGGGNGSASNSGAGGGGGAGCISEQEVVVVPGETLTITIGAYGAGGLTNTNGSNGGNSTVSGSISGTVATFQGGGGGGAGASGAGAANAGNDSIGAGGEGSFSDATTGPWLGIGGGGGGGSLGPGGKGAIVWIVDTAVFSRLPLAGSQGSGGGGGQGNGVAVGAQNGAAGGRSIYQTSSGAGGAGASTAGGGGGGGSGFGVGAAGGAAGVAGADAAPNSAAGGGGAGSTVGGGARAGGRGGTGYVRISW